MKPGPQGLCKHMNSVETLPKWQQFKTKNKTHVPDSSWHCLKSSILCIQSSRWGSLHAPSAICRLNSAALPRLLSSKIWGSQGSESDLSRKARCAWDVHQLMPAIASNCRPWCLGVRSPVVELKSRNGWNLSDSCLGCIVRRQRPWWTGKWQRSKHLQHFMIISWSFHALLYLCKNDVLHCTPQKITICKCITYMQLCQDMSSANSTVLEAGALGIAPANTASLPAPTGDSVVRTRDPCISWLKLSLGIQPHLSGTGCNSRAYTRQKKAKKINMKPALRSRELGLMLRLRQILTSTNMSSHRKPSKMQSLCLAIARCRAMSQHTAAHVKLV